MRIYYNKSLDVYVGLDHVQNENVRTGGATPAIIPTVYLWKMAFKNKFGPIGGFKVEKGQIAPHGVDKPWFERNYEFYSADETGTKLPTTTGTKHEELETE